MSFVLFVCFSFFGRLAVEALRSVRVERFLTVRVLVPR